MGGKHIMPEKTTSSLWAMYEQDETAWLEEMAKLVSQRRFDELDHEHLQEYLLDMARRDKREVLSRLVVLLSHLLKWDHQPEQRSNSWHGTILAQRDELQGLLESGTLRRYASEVLPKAYKKAIQRAAAESGLAKDAFPGECHLALEDVVPPDEAT
jgi:hypothetical protein